VVVERSVNWIGVLAHVLFGVKLKLTVGGVPVKTPLGIDTVSTHPFWVVIVS
jgi:hypothetical protein